MGYLHIENLYKNQMILLFRECYALEKIHGTSTYVAWKDGKVWFSSGGETHERFVSLFDEPRLAAAFSALGHPKVTVFGEAYGGKQQGQAWRYGKSLKFVAFDVRIESHWLSVPQAEDVVRNLSLEFVAYEKISTDLVALNALRDASSVQAKRNGIEKEVPREGIVLRPLVEMSLNNGDRVIVKHKRDEERETAHSRKVVDPQTLEVLTNASMIAEEWVTEMRLTHVLDKLSSGGLVLGIERTGDVVRAMQEDVFREGAGEIVDDKVVRQAVGRKAATLFKLRVQGVFGETK